MIRRLSGLQRWLIVLMLSLALVPFSAGAQGNSDAAHACQGEGYLYLVGVGGETFRNVGQCVSYAAKGGAFASGMIGVPAGFSITFSDQVLAACNELTFGFVLNGEAQSLGSKPMTACGGNDTFFFDPLTIGPMTEDSVLALYLTDHSCFGNTYSSNGDHSRVVGFGPVFEIDIADAGPGCSIVASPWPHASLGYEGNISLTVTVHP